MSLNKIAHLTSVHPRFDTRILFKECKSLADAGFDVFLLVADGSGDEITDGVSIVDVGKLDGRIKRSLISTRKVYAKALELDADIYHVHDPELLPAAVKLKRHGKTVIFDSHEDVPKQILGKPYLSKLTKWLLSHIFEKYEIWACKQLDAIVAATPYIHEKFVVINPDTINVNNFPILGELSSADSDWSQKKRQVCYVGAISTIRGIKEIVSAMEFLNDDTKLVLGGRFSDLDAEREVKTYSGWKNVEALGLIDRQKVGKVLGESVAGLVTLHPITNYIDALPVKMFEYMSAGIPVIASDFPLLRKIIDEHQCGLYVNPMDPGQIAEAIEYLVENRDIAQEMGNNGMRAIHTKYNWPIEKEKLVSLYTKLSLPYQ